MGVYYGETHTDDGLIIDELYFTWWHLIIDKLLGDFYIFTDGLMKRSSVLVAVIFKSEYNITNQSSVHLAMRWSHAPVDARVDMSVGVTL